MNTHLTPQQISQWVLGDFSWETEAHLRTCSLCQEEICRFDASLKGFRSSVRYWSESRLPPFSSMPQPRRNLAQSWIMGLCWAAAAIILCVFIGRFAHQPVPTRQTAAADAALLAQIDNEVSQTVPGAMEPLTQLVSWDVNSVAPADGKSPSKKQAQ